MKFFGRIAQPYLQLDKRTTETHCSNIQAHILKAIYFHQWLSDLLCTMRLSVSVPTAALVSLIISLRLRPAHY